MKISYGITVCNEAREFNRLFEFLIEHRRDKDEIVVLVDKESKSDEVMAIIEELGIGLPNFKWIEHELQNDFANHKNYLTFNCTGDWVFQIDADEMPSTQLISKLPELLELNDHLDLLRIPRENFVEGITQAHIQQWRWVVDDNNRINYPDYQDRIYKNKGSIKWINKVHERISGYGVFTNLPMNSGWDLIHEKTISKQEMQNERYSQI